MWEGTTQGPEYQEAILDTGSHNYLPSSCLLQSTEPRRESHVLKKIGFSVDAQLPAPKALHLAWQCAVYCASLSNLSSNSLNSYFKILPAPNPTLSPALVSLFILRKGLRLQFYRKKYRESLSSCDQTHMYPPSLSAVAVEELPLKADSSTCALDPALSPFQEPFIINHLPPLPPPLTNPHYSSFMQLFSS